MEDDGRTVLELEVLRHFAYERKSADRLVVLSRDDVRK
jgi:hypothetical protein